MEHTTTQQAFHIKNGKTEFQKSTTRRVLKQVLKLKATVRIQMLQLPQTLQTIPKKATLNLQIKVNAVQAVQEDTIYVHYVAERVEHGSNSKNLIRLLNSMNTRENWRLAPFVAAREGYGVKFVMEPDLSIK